MVASQLHTFVYRDVGVALQALLQAATIIQARRLEEGTANLFSEHLYFRGQHDITHRLLPSRLRGPQHEPMLRQRFSVDTALLDNDQREHFGNWYENVEPMRLIEDSIAELSESELQRRDALEASDINRASSIAAIAQLSHFQKRAAVRHYSGAPSSILDTSTNPEVAAFFATSGGSKQPHPNQMGMLWAIDLNFLAGLFTFEITSIANGERVKLREARDNWGINKKLFEDQGILPVCLELTSVSLPFRRPQAQHARFFSLTGEDGTPLPLLTEMTWWSIIERQAYNCAFIHNGSTYENPSHNITCSALMPSDEELAIILAD
jgi:hypothetical protein